MTLERPKTFDELLKRQQRDVEYIERSIRNVRSIATASPKPNLIINGDFRINQRGIASPVALSAVVRAFDCWVFSGGGTTATVTFPGTLNGQEISMTRGDSPTTPYAYQTIEQRNLPAGDYVVSWAGTMVGQVYNVRTATYEFPTRVASPYTFTSDGLSDYRFYFFDVSGTRTLGKVKVEPGTVPTPFVTGDYGEELLRAKRYLQVFSGVSGASSWPAYYHSASTVWATIPFPVEMRATPTLTFTNGTDAWRAISPGGTDYFDTMAAGYSFRNSITVVGTGNASGTSGTPCIVSPFSGGVIVASAEL